MNIIESFLKGKKNDGSCEDELFVSEDFAAIIDGVTSKTNFTYEKQTTGKLAANLIKNVLRKLNKKAKVEDFIEQVNLSFEHFYKEVDFNFDKNKFGLQAMAVIYSNERREIWLIGDCQAVIKHELVTNYKKSDLVLEEMRSLIANIEIKEKNLTEKEYFEQNDPAREYILPWVIDSHIFANNDDSEYGYSLLNGEDIPLSLIKIIRLDSTKQEVILASDGYPKLDNTLERSESRLQDNLTKDQHCIHQYKSTKGIVQDQVSFDDRAYLRFEINAE